MNNGYRRLNWNNGLGKALKISKTARYTICGKIPSPWDLSRFSQFGEYRISAIEARDPMPFLTCLQMGPLGFTIISGNGTSRIETTS